VVCAPRQFDHTDGCGFIFSASDITDRKKMEETIWHQANYDSLTELPNRNLFSDRLSEALISAKRRGTEFALVFIDLDNFKNINDSLGHAAGDKVLQQAAERIANCLRESDSVARLGGDEFVLLLPSDEGRTNYDRVTQRVLGRLAESFHPTSIEVYASGSIGLAIYPHDGDDSDTLMMNADTAMYQAKQAGRNQISYYSQSMSSELKALL
ncbi:MAG TPA: GGDEF domain-containing protein, partial [Porticoccus sp.]|nr:GGDEF domain-containing protein [Porticoccus sp.]